MIVPAGTVPNANIQYTVINAIIKFTVYLFSPQYENVLKQKKQIFLGKRFLI